MEAGLDPAQFWQLTLREIQVIIDAAARRLQREHEMTAWHAWTTASLGRLKRIPPLRKILPKGMKRQQTAEEMQAIALAWHARLTGSRG